MKRLVKWCVVPAVLVAGLVLAAPDQANAGGFGISFYSGGYGSDCGYGAYGPSSYGSYYGPGWYTGGSPYRYNRHGYGYGFGGYGVGYGGYGGPGSHHHCW